MRYTKQKVKETLMVPEEVMRERRHAWLAESWARYQDEQRHKPKPVSIAAEWEKEHPGKEFGGFELINLPKEEPKPADRVTVLEAKVDALETQDSTLEECIVEIANVVYA